MATSAAVKPSRKPGHAAEQDGAGREAEREESGSRRHTPSSQQRPSM